RGDAHRLDEMTDRIVAGEESVGPCTRHDDLLERLRGIVAAGRALQDRNAQRLKIMSAHAAAVREEMLGRVATDDPEFARRKVDAGRHDGAEGGAQDTWDRVQAVERANLAPPDGGGSPRRVRAHTRREHVIRT